MVKVTQAFHDFFKGLELTDAEHGEASRQHNDLRIRIRKQLDEIQHDFLVGSYARGTAIRPLNDIDLFLVLDPQVHTDRHARNKKPMHLLDHVQSALVNCYSRPGPQLRIQGHSVNIEFSGTGIGYDVIPAFCLSPAAGDREDMTYEIPDRDREAWINTNPGRHRRQCIDANERAGGMLNRLVKAAKHWNRGQRDSTDHKPLRSFHLEVMAYEAFSTKPTDERRGLRALFAFLASRVLRECPDPAKLGPHVDAGMGPEERQRVQRKLQEAERIASEAIRQEERGDHIAACNSWRSLLGAPFPS